MSVNVNDIIGPLIVVGFGALMSGAATVVLGYYSIKEKMGFFASEQKDMKERMNNFERKQYEVESSVAAEISKIRETLAELRVILLQLQKVRHNGDS